MKSVAESTEQAMLDYWRQRERIPPGTPVRTDILHPGFPRDVRWHVAEIEGDDLRKLYMISVPDFGPISRGTWQITEAADNYASGFRDEDHASRIEKLLKDPPLGRLLIVVAAEISGPYTILDGNHWATILQTRGDLVGARCHLGLHPGIRHYNFAGMAYRNCR